ncbi:hypothetical protein CDEF62S_02081 [Castellaniella defragrans]
MKKTLALCALASLMFSSPILAKTYRATNWLQPIHTLNSEPYQKFAKELKKATNGDISFTVFSGGSLVPAKATLQALRDGTAQLGIVYPGHTPAELPLNNVLVDLGFLVKDPMAAAFAYTEINLSDPKLIAEWQKQKVLFAGGYSTPAYNFMCATPIKTLADAKGKKTQDRWPQRPAGLERDALPRVGRSRLRLGPDAGRGRGIPPWPNATRRPWWRGGTTHERRVWREQMSADAKGGELTISGASGRRHLPANNHEARKRSKGDDL